MEGKKVTEFKSVKIKVEYYNLVKAHKEAKGVSIDFFIGQAILEKFERESVPRENKTNQ